MSPLQDVFSRCHDSGEFLVKWVIEDRVLVSVELIPSVMEVLARIGFELVKYFAAGISVSCEGVLLEIGEVVLRSFPRCVD